MAALCAALYACTSTKKITAPNAAVPKLLGVHTEKDLRKKPYSEWFVKNYNDYKIDTATAEMIKPLLAGKQIEIFMGTWCGDSKREVPRMLKILKYCNLPLSNIKIIMVDNEDSSYKQSPTHEERNLNIHRVPDLLIYDKNIEKGRIVEEPVESIEKDLLTLLQGKKYETSYRGINYLHSQFTLHGIEGVEKDSARIVAALKPLLKGKFEIGPYARIMLNSGYVRKGLLIYTLNTLAFPTEADVFYRMGAYYLQTGDTINAKTNFEKALQLKPGYEDAQKKLEELK